jgi:large subunit ribosomal protein L17
MVRSHNFKPRLNMGSKHRWSMLRNMTASLFLHERIKVTHATTKALVPVVNNIFRVAMDKTTSSKDRLKGFLFVHNAAYKTINHLVNRFGKHVGGVCRVKLLSTRRSGDNARMAIVELINK